jgi:DNA (cytosine-5)-methyltransferase 1
MRVLDLFSGIGGLALGLERAGLRTVAFCERDAYAAAVLRERFPGVPVYDDVCTLTADRLAADGVPRPDVIAGGFPCQDISFAGFGAGLAGERSGLWREFARLIGELRPRFVVVENVAALLARGLGDVLGDLARIGYDAEWSVVSACSVGAPHVRRRVFVVAYPDSIYGWPGLRDTAAQPIGAVQAIDSFESARAGWRARLANPSALYGGADGVPYGMERNRAIGNAVVPQVAEAIGRALMRCTDGSGGSRHE